MVRLWDLRKAGVQEAASTSDLAKALCEMQTRARITCMCCINSGSSQDHSGADTKQEVHLQASNHSQVCHATWQLTCTMLSSHAMVVCC